MKLSQEYLGTYYDQAIYKVTMENEQGLQMVVCNFGATLMRLLVPDAAGILANVVLGYDSLEQYVNDPFYIGCLVGRFAGRISNGGFGINGTYYPLFENDPKRKIHLHGGNSGFNKKVFTILSIQNECSCQSVELYYQSKDGDEGYPGKLDLWVTYTLTKKNEIIIEYKAQTDKATHVNLTNHSYFNLTAVPGKALQQELYINADQFLETDDHYIPTGRMKSVENANHDFRKLKRIDYYYPNQKFTGYNECFVLNKDAQQENPAAVLFDPGSNRKMKISTTDPGLVFYTADYLESPFLKCQGVCLETEFFPDTPNRPEFPTTLLMPGAELNQRTVYQFSW